MFFLKFLFVLFWGDFRVSNRVMDVILLIIDGSTALADAFLTKRGEKTLTTSNKIELQNAQIENN